MAWSLNIGKLVLGIMLLAALAACRHAPPRTTAPPSRSKVQYSAAYDAEIAAILELARKGQWEEAEAHADALYERAPRDPMVERLRSWVRQERQARREKALEDDIRTVHAKGSVFKPTPESLLTEKRERGLPPRKDVRDAVEQIEATPYIPEKYGRTIREKGPLFDLGEAQGRMAQLLDKEISVHLDNATLEAIIFNIGQAQGLNFVADKSLPAFQQRLSVNLEKVKLSEFLNYVSRNFEVQFQVGQDLIWIVDAKDPKKVLEHTRFYRLRHGFILPAEFSPMETTKQSVTAGNVTTVTEISKSERFVRDTAPAKPSLESAIKQFFQGSAYYIDYERNLIVARGTTEQLRVLERLIEEFDRPLQQVLIEARFITVSEAAFLRLGVVWGAEGLTLTNPPSGDQIGLSPLSVDVARGFLWNWTNVFGVRNLTATLTALQQSGESQTLSAPRLTVVNNMPATISDGRMQYYYEEFTSSQQIVAQAGVASTIVPMGKPTKAQSGVMLDVMASIGGDGKTILLALRPQVSQEVKLVEYATIKTPGAGAGAPGGEFTIKLPEARTQTLSTRVMVRSGETVVMGGVLERQQTTYVESVPVLGDLPLIGTVFRRRTEVDKPRYLLIFVTATLLADTGEFVTYDTDEKP